MRIVFFGTPDFALDSLKKLRKSRHELIGVVTAPDKERGRGRKISYTPVKEYALSEGIETLQPVNLADPDFIEKLTGFNADLFVVVAFRILPPAVFTIPRKGSINLHGSLLPSYRGAAPIQRAIMSGEKKTGLTTFFLEESVDTGNVILQQEIEILPEDNFGSLHDKMKGAGADLVERTVELIETGNAVTRKQDDTLSSRAPKIRTEDCRIDFDRKASEVHNQVRGLSPYPAAFFVRNGKKFKVYRTETVDLPDISPGEIRQGKDRLEIGCSGGAVRILEIQPEGRKKMNVEEFLRGYSLL